MPGAFKRILEDLFKGSEKKEDMGFKENKKKDFDMNYRASQDEVLKGLFDYMYQREG
jgi:hypothetical protein